GILNAKGLGTERDPEAALALFRRAATSGYSLAQLNLASALDHGRLTPHDPVRAYIWYSIAARLSADPAVRDKAAQGRDRLGHRIALPDLEAARSTALSWTPGSPDPNAGVTGRRHRVGPAPAGELPISGGSGFVVSRAGDVVTNYHVVDECRELRV